MARRAIDDASVSQVYRRDELEVDSLWSESCQAQAGHLDSYVASLWRLCAIITDTASLSPPTRNRPCHETPKDPENCRQEVHAMCMM
jgi:hypothetical protein